MWRNDFVSARLGGENLVLVYCSLSLDPFFSSGAPLKTLLLHLLRRFPPPGPIFSVVVSFFSFGYPFTDSNCWRGRTTLEVFLFLFPAFPGVFCFSLASAIFPNCAFPSLLSLSCPHTFPFLILLQILGSFFFFPPAGPSPVCFLFAPKRTPRPSKIRPPGKFSPLGFVLSQGPPVRRRAAFSPGSLTFLLYSQYQRVFRVWISRTSLGFPFQTFWLTALLGHGF